jgi:uncharacterized membrane protein YphA (DoxX/SURF4 family)
LPGLGLLLLRTTLGITTIVQSGKYLSGQSDSSGLIIFAAIASIICGILLLLGFLTPIAGVLLFASGMIAAIFLFPYFAEVYIYEIILFASVVLLGPGTFSVDAKLFGRREIIIPKN